MDTRKKGYLCIVITAVLFSSMEVVLKSIAGDFNPIQLTFTRFLIGGAVLLPFALHELHERGIALDRAALKTFSLLGLIGIATSMTFYQLAVCDADASEVAVLFSSNPVFVTALAFLLLGASVSRFDKIAIALDIAAVAAIINPLNAHMGPAGIAFSLLATVSFSLYGVLGKKHCARYGGVTVACFGFLLGSAQLMAAAALTHVPQASSWLAGAGLSQLNCIPFFSGYTASNIAPVLFAGIFVTGAGYACYFKAMEYTSASTASLVFFIKPVLAPIIAFAVLGEGISGNMLAGMALMLAGSAVSLAPALLSHTALASRFARSAADGLSADKAGLSA